MTQLPRLPQRLGKLLRERTGLSLSSLEVYYRQGRIALSRAAPEGLRELTFDEDCVLLDGEPLPPQTACQYFAFHKPLNVVTTVRAPDGAPDLSPWLQSLAAPVFPVGRLDRDSSGLLILTSDGDLAYALLSPEHHVEKEYRLTLRGELPATDARLGRLREPMLIDRITMTMAELELLWAERGTTLLRVVLKEGKHRQLRKMCRQAGLVLTELRRERIGPVHLHTLPSGNCRSLTNVEVEGLWQAVGGRQHVRERQLLALTRVAEQGRSAGMPHARLERWLDEHLLRFAVPQRQEQTLGER